MYQVSNNDLRQMVRSLELMAKDRRVEDCTKMQNARRLAGKLAKKYKQRKPM